MKRHPLPHNEPSLQLGHTREGKPFILTGSDFERHKVISGITGAGKSYFLASIFLFLFRLGVTVQLIDPNGDLAKLILTLLAGSDFFADRRAYEKLYYIDFKRAEIDAAIAFNVLNQPYEAHTVASNLLEAMHRAFPVSGTTTSLDNVLLAASLVLIENHLPITELPRLILDNAFRESLLRNVSDQLVIQFFKSKFGEKVNSNLVDSAMRRSFLLTFSPVLRNTLGQQENKLDFRHLLDTGISCIFNLGGLDDQSKRLLGGALLVNIEQAFLSRADMDQSLRKPAHIIVDEFPVFASHSEQSFAAILEQVRKYKGTLYMAFQTHSQISASMAGSLQNALSITMRAGYSDSTTLVQHFYRQPQEQSRGWLDPLLELFGLKEKQPQGVFAAMENKEQGRYLFETLQIGEAIVSVNGISTLIKTNTIPPVQVEPFRLQEIEHTYTTRLLSPLSRIGNAPVSVDTDIVAASLPIAKRCVPCSSAPPTPFQTGVGVPGTDTEVQAIVSLYGYMTVAQMAKVLGKSENTARNKLSGLVDAGILTTSSLPRTTPSGKTPTVYSTKSKKPARSLVFLDHALATSEILITTALLPTIHDCTILDLRSDDSMKVAPFKLPDKNIFVPDGFVRLHCRGFEYAVYFEIDRNTETAKEKILSKLNNYKMLAAQCDCMIVVFCCVEGGDLRVKTLRRWAEDVLPDAYRHLFWFAAIDLSTLTPETLFLTPILHSIGENTLQSLLLH